MSISRKFKNILPESLHWWLFAVLRGCTGGVRAPGVKSLIHWLIEHRQKERPQQPELQKIIISLFSEAQHTPCKANTTYETWVGDMTAGWDGGAAATFCLSLLKKELCKNYSFLFLFGRSPEGVIVFQTCTGRGCSCCCLLDTWVLMTCDWN